MKKKVDPKLRQEVKVKIDIVTSDDIKIYYTGKFQDFTARCIIIIILLVTMQQWGALTALLPVHSSFERSSCPK